MRILTFMYKESDWCSKINISWWGKNIRHRSNTYPHRHRLLKRITNPPQETFEETPNPIKLNLHGTHRHHKILSMLSHRKLEIWSRHDKPMKSIDSIHYHMNRRSIIAWWRFGVMDCWMDAMSNQKARGHVLPKLLEPTRRFLMSPFHSSSITNTFASCFTSSRLSFSLEI